MRASTFVAFASIILVSYSGAAQEPPRLPQGPPGTVTLPVPDYDRLVALASHPAPRPDPPPVPSVLSRADLRAHVAGGAVRGSVRLEGETFARGSVKVPLVSGATLLEARAGARPLPVLRDGEAHAAILPGAAPFTITLEWAATVSAVPGRASFTLPLPAAGTISATIDLPGDPPDVRVEPGIVTGRQTAGGRTVLDVALQAGRPAQVSWSVREAAAQAPAAPARMLADVRSLVAIGEADLRLVSVVEITVVRGAPRSFQVRLPQGFDVSSLSGTSVETSDAAGGTATFTVSDGSRRRHQFLLVLERPRADSSFKLDTSFPTIPAAQREVGEVAVEAAGTVEVAVSGDAGLRRIDVREAHPSLRALAGRPLLAAFRYQRRQAEDRTLTVDVTRFADAPVIAAVAERAVATTLVTSEGRMLSEVQLTLRNRAQPFMRVVLPEGFRLVSAEVAGEPAKPVAGTDGIRVPLLRSGFRPDGAYVVSFVYEHAAVSALGKRGETRMVLPSLDVPVNVLEWELFFPERFSAKPVSGNVIPAYMLGVTSAAAAIPTMSATAPDVSSGRGSGSSQLRVVSPGQVLGRITDQSGGVLPGAQISVRGPRGAALAALSDRDGYYVLNGVPSGRIEVRAELEGFRSVQQSFEFDQRPRQLDFQLAIGAATETVTVQAEAPFLGTGSRPAARDALQVQQAPSQNVVNLHRRVSGVLPVPIDVPRAGALFAFVRPLVLQEDTVVVFKYKRR